MSHPSYFGLFYWYGWILDQLRHNLWVRVQFWVLSGSLKVGLRSFGFKMIRFVQSWKKRLKLRPFFQIQPSSSASSASDRVDDQSSHIHQINRPKGRQAHQEKVQNPLFGRKSSFGVIRRRLWTAAPDSTGMSAQGQISDGGVKRGSKGQGRGRPPNRQG